MPLKPIHPINNKGATNTMAISVRLGYKAAEGWALDNLFGAMDR
jgi:hypothetical protein